jgi:hypothetical protein
MESGLNLEVLVEAEVAERVETAGVLMIRTEFWRTQTDKAR